MKTAEEILDKYLANYPWQHWSKENAIKAMEEYRLQSHPSPMSADAKPFTEENVKDMIESDATYEWMANNMNEFIFEWLKSNAPSVKADGWVSVDKEKEFHKVLKCLKNNKVMVGTREDGIYIRLAGRESEGEAFTLHFALAYPFPKLPPHQNKNK